MKAARRVALAASPGVVPVPVAREAPVVCPEPAAKCQPAAPRRRAGQEARAEAGQAQAEAGQARAEAPSVARVARVAEAARAEAGQARSAAARARAAPARVAVGPAALAPRPKTRGGTGPHDVVIETNPGSGIKCGTIYRPKELKGTEKYPILVWGEGSCAQDGLSNQAALAELASWGYFIVADGTPGGQNACQSQQNGKPFLDYVTWAIEENSKPCSAYYQSLQTTKVAADGFSCGGLMAANVSGDPRFSAIGITSSGLMSPNASLYQKIHTPFKIMNGGSGDIAYANGLRDYEEISKLSKPILYFSKKSAGHGGDLGQARGDFNRVNLAWLNWQLKGDQGATGKGFLSGSTCTFCTDNGWDYKSANLP